jgi:hypothetical protein
VLGGSHFDLENGGGRLEIFSRTTGGPFTINLGNCAVDFCSEPYGLQCVFLLRQVLMSLDCL